MGQVNRFYFESYDKGCYIGVMMERADNTKKKIVTSASRVSSLTMVSRLLGIARSTLFATIFGTTYFGDAFNVAFLIPNFFRMVLGEGVMNASYIPLYAHSLQQGGQKEAVQFAQKAFSVFLVILGLVILAGISFAHPIVQGYAFGWKDKPEVFMLTVKLTRLLFPYILFVGLAALVGGTLNCRGYFSTPAFAPSTLNICLITTSLLLIVFSNHATERTAVIFSIGALAGGITQIAVQIPRYLKTGHRLHFDPDFRDPGIVSLWKLMLPGFITFAAMQVNILVDTLLATTLPEGSVTALRLGNRVAVQPIGIFGVAIATVLLPTLSSHVARKDESALVEDLVFSIKLMFALLLPSLLLILVLGKPIVRLLFQYGEFSAERSTPMTVTTLKLYALGLLGYGGSKAVTQAFYSMKNTVTPMKIGIFTILFNIVLNLILVRLIGIGGLALATSISATAGFTFLLIAIKRRLLLPANQIVGGILKMAFASLVMAIVAYAVSWRLEAYQDIIAMRLVQVILAGVSGVLIYLLLGLALRIQEIIFLLDVLRMKLLRK